MSCLEKNLCCSNLFTVEVDKPENQIQFGLLLLQLTNPSTKFELRVASKKVHWNCLKINPDPELLISLWAEYSFCPKIMKMTKTSIEVCCSLVKIFIDLEVKNYSYFLDKSLKIWPQ